MNYEKHKKRADIIKSMAHPIRLIIIEALTKNEKCVCELNELVDVDQSTLSRHLSVLKNSGIITDEKRGLNVFYSLRCPCVLNYIECVEGVLNTKRCDY